MKSFDRFISLVGSREFDKIAASTVTVVGLGGVGGAAAEALVRYGVGSLVFVDGDSFEETNLNRQILCTVGNLGKNKAIVAAKRASEVSPSASVRAISEYVTEKNVRGIIDGSDLVVDAIDDFSGKIALIAACKAAGIPIVSAMGAGNRLECDFAACDIFETAYDPFAKRLRRELKKIGIESLDVVCAKSPPIVTTAGAPASAAAPPIVMGAMLAALAVKRLTER